MRCKQWTLVALTAVILAGCKGSSGPDGSPTSQSPSTQIAAADAAAPGSSAPATSATKQHIASDDTSQPASAVAVFLDALRRGDDEKILAMYTVRARQQASQEAEHFAPKGSDTATFEVGEVQYLAEDGARVASRWTDLDQNGQSHTMEFLWMVRREPQGWRVAGMAATPFPGEPPLLLDFENLEETKRRIELLAEEIQRRSEMEAAPEQQAKSNDDSARR